MALGKYKLALRDYERVCKVRPNDKDAKLKFTECRKIVQQIAFNKAISVEDQKAASVAEALDIESMTVEDKYDGPKLNLEQSSGKNNQMSIYVRVFWVIYQDYAKKNIVKTHKLHLRASIFIQFLFWYLCLSRPDGRKRSAPLEILE